MTCDIKTTHTLTNKQTSSEFLITAHTSGWNQCISPEGLEGILGAKKQLFSEDLLAVTNISFRPI